MQNLAGHPQCDYYIEEELKMARIRVVHVPKSTGEVGYTIEGKLGPFTFRRAWTYWVVSGDLKLPIAKELYADPLGKAHVRVDGHCGCPHPTAWSSMPKKRRLELQALVPGYTENIPSGGAKAWMVEAKKLEALMKKEKRTDDWVINTYHIDSLAGLRLFADTLRKHNLHRVK